MRHKKEFTNPALLAGLWVFLSMLEIMEAFSQEERKRESQPLGSLLEGNRSALSVTYFIILYFNVFGRTRKRQ